MSYLERMPEQPVEPKETKHTPAMSDEEEDALMVEFCKEHGDQFVDFVNGYDGCILDDFIESMRWKWNGYKMEHC